MFEDRPAEFLMKAKLLSFILPAILVAAALFAQEHHHEGMVSIGDLGSVNFPISCAAGTQETFTRGVALLYSFEYEQAQRAFESVAQKDPACAMAYWGQGMSLYHQLWDRPSKTSLQHGAELLSKASALKSTPREHDYIQALAVFYRDPDQDHEKRADAYCAAMKGVTERNAQDREAQVFYALALLGSAPENDMQHKNERAAVAILNKLFQEQPRHPGVAHYIIHSCDNPQMAGLALPAARKYAEIAPSSAHAVHMPSHIFARLGLWQDDIQSNLRAIEIADQQAAMHMHTTHHRVHSMDFLEYAYLQIGDDAKAHEQVVALSTMKAMPGDEDFMFDYLRTRQIAAPMVYAIERRQWKEALALEPLPDGEPYVKTPIYWGKAVAAGHLHDAAAAQDALKHYDELVEATRKGPKPYVGSGFKQQRKELVAWADYAAGKQDEAVRELTAVADEQDKVGKGETDLPAREMLADMLLESGKPKEALEQYEISLKTDPNRFNGLYGAAQAASQLQQKDKATSFYTQLLKNCDGIHSDRPELQQAKTLVAAK
jgi:tetratricopeptide (TPR) repeat protein